MISSLYQGIRYNQSLVWYTLYRLIIYEKLKLSCALFSGYLNPAFDNAVELDDEDDDNNNELASNDDEFTGNSYIINICEWFLCDITSRRFDFMQQVMAPVH